MGKGALEKKKEKSYLNNRENGKRFLEDLFG
jgi:hypothetical protein